MYADFEGQELKLPTDESGGFLGKTDSYCRSYELTPKAVTVPLNFADKTPSGVFAPAAARF